MKWSDIASEMGVGEARMCSYRVTLQRAEKEAEVAANGPSSRPLPPVLCAGARGRGASRPMSRNLHRPSPSILIVIAAPIRLISYVVGQSRLAALAHGGPTLTRG
jgi:hypothetical protein